MCYFRKLSNSKSIGEQLVTTSCHYSRDEIIQSRQAQIIIKAQAVKAAREEAAVRRTAAKEIHMAAVRAKVTAVKIMKSLGVKDTAIKTDTTPKVVPARRPRKVRVQLISDVHPSHVETNIVKTSEVTVPVCENQTAIVDMNIEITPIQPEQVSLTPSPEELRAARICEMKALRATKARLAVASLAIEEASRVEAAVTEAEQVMKVVDSVAEKVANVAAIKARRAAKMAAAITALHHTEETLTTAIKEEITTLQTAVDCCVENFRTIGVIVRRIKAIIPQPERVEMIDPEIEASVVIELPSRRWVYPRLGDNIIIPKRRVRPHRRGWKWLLLERDGVGSFPHNLHSTYIWLLIHENTSSIPLHHTLII